MTQCDRVLAILADGKEHSHHDFYGFCVLHSRISELRARGHQIEVRRDGDTYLYRLVPAEVSPAESGHGLVRLPGSVATEKPGRGTMSISTDAAAAVPSAVAAPEDDELRDALVDDLARMRENRDRVLNSFPLDNDDGRHRRRDYLAQADRAIATHEQQLSLLTTGEEAA